MKAFHCDHCGNLAFFENTRCTNCHRLLAYLPDLTAMASLDLCQNYNGQGICNWAIPVGDSNPLCSSCRLTQLIPNLSRPGSVERWQRLEAPKRRLMYGLAQLRLPVMSKAEDPEAGLAFQFCADEDTADATPTLTGHDAGLITVNVAEADDHERERRRV